MEPHSLWPCNHWLAEMGEGSADTLANICIVEVTFFLWRQRSFKCREHRLIETIGGTLYRRSYYRSIVRLSQETGVVLG